MDVLADKFEILEKGDGSIRAIMRIAPDGIRFVLEDGRSWPAHEVEVIYDGAGIFQRAILKATGEVVLTAEQVSGTH